MFETWAVMPTKGRPEIARTCIRSLNGQVDGVVVVDNNDVPDVSILEEFEGVSMNLHHPGYPPNISELLNVGIDAVERIVEGDHVEWNVALLNDDVTVPPGWAESLITALRSSGAAAAYTDRLNRPHPVLYRTIPVIQPESMTCWACIIRGELRLRWDDAIKWWYSDNDFDYRCRSEYGGVVAVPGEIPNHSHPSAQTFSDAVLSAQAHLDEVTFNAKWSRRV